MYAIIESCGRQYKVAEGDVVIFEKLDTEEGKNVTFDNVTFNLTDASANWEHYFAQTNESTITMTGCTINGLISTN